jgi:photosystem II stability/assembly factor-like uncharacterized protein/molybdopterin converting factor small subunit
MATFHLPSSLRSLADGAEQVEVPGTTLREALRQLERTHPRLAGWVLDERGALRPHVSLFLNEEQAAPESPVGAGDQVHIVPAISGGNPDDVAGEAGAAEEVEVLVGTRKGLLVLRGPRGGQLTVAARRFAGQPVEYALRDPRSGRYLASVTHSHFGPKLFLSDDPEAPDDAWEQAAGPTFPEETGAAVEKIWIVEPAVEDGVLWAGVAPAALFRSADGGRSWELVRGLWDVPGREKWAPGAGGLCLHSICPWPGDPKRLTVGISTAGVWQTEDGGTTWRRTVSGLVPRYIPEEARATTHMFCVHKLLRAAREPETLYMQFHGGVYRSDDAGETWNDIGTNTGLPSDFGFPLVLDPQDPNRAYVIPLVADVDRVTPEGRLRVYETKDRGTHWQAQAAGLPQEGRYLTILRQAFHHDGGDPLGLYFGAESGDLYASADGGASWLAVAQGLPPILSVRARRVSAD